MSQSNFNTSVCSLLKPGNISFSKWNLKKVLSMSQGYNLSTNDAL